MEIPTIEELSGAHTVGSCPDTFQEFNEKIRECKSGDYVCDEVSTWVDKRGADGIEWFHQGTACNLLVLGLEIGMTIMHARQEQALQDAYDKGFHEGHKAGRVHG